MAKYDYSPHVISHFVEEGVETLIYKVRKFRTNGLIHKLQKQGYAAEKGIPSRLNGKPDTKRDLITAKRIATPASLR